MKSKIILGIFSFMLASIPPAFANEEKVLHFVHISDTHVSFEHEKNKAKLKKGSVKVLKTAVKQINSLKDIDFVIATGDLINKPKEELLNNFFQITDALNPPLYVTLGNHDIGVNVPLTKEKLIKRFYERENATSFTNQMSYYSFHPNNKVIVICLDTTSSSFRSRLGRIDHEQLFWFKNQLERNRDKLVIIAMHVSPVDPFNKNRFFFDPSKKDFLDMIKSYKNIIGILTGDYHIARIFKKHKKWFVITPATVRYPGAFREIIITESKSKFLHGFLNKKAINIEFKWHVINEPKLLKSTSKWKTSRGRRKDRRRKIKLLLPDS